MLTVMQTAGSAPFLPLAARRFSQPLGNCHGLLLAEAGPDGHELLSPGDRRDPPVEAGRAPGREAAQLVVTLFVTVTIIDAFEMIDVQHADRHRVALHREVLEQFVGGRPVKPARFSAPVR